MKNLKRLASSFMALTIFLGLTACSAKTFDHKKMVKFGEDHDYEMFDDTDDYLELDHRCHILRLQGETLLQRRHLLFQQLEAL